MKKIFILILFTAIAMVAGINMKLGISSSDSMPVLTLNNVEQLSNAELVVINNGYVGLFNGSPSYVLEIGTSGQSRVAKINGTWIATSDSRAKENVRDLPNSLDL
ncbi:MAG: NVEALA domain-containing protein, partial [Dysgonamonadaceae bacterium]|nr:NVEALA domain-containing protein [Dysgonamonadaceae bacterium]